MRPDEFGGFAIRITRTAIRSISTWEWLAEQDVRSRIAATTSAIAEADAVGIAPEPPALTLRAALTWILDDFTDAGQDRDPITGVEYDSVAYARAAPQQCKWLICNAPRRSPASTASRSSRR
jgi:hypothetical protein